MTDQIDKAQIVAELRTRIEAQLDALTASQHASQAGASHAEARAEHPKDTRATEAAYLARGLAERVGQLQTALTLLMPFTPGPFSPSSPVALGALVELEDETGATTLHMIVPAAAGEKVTIGGATIHALSPTSPLGQELIDRELDDEFDVDLPRGRTSLTILAIR